jgi:hypothetical protein
MALFCLSKACARIRARLLHILGGLESFGMSHVLRVRFGLTEISKE